VCAELIKCNVKRKLLIDLQEKAKVSSQNLHKAFYSLLCWSAGVMHLWALVRPSTEPGFFLEHYMVTTFFFLYMFFGEPTVHFFPNFFLYRPSQRSARSQVPSQVAAHQEVGSQLWAGETPDLNSGLLDNSLVRYVRYH
jgi:hypothetical protein